MLIGNAARTGAGQAAVAVDALGLSLQEDAGALAIVAEPLSAGHGEAIGHGSGAGALLFIGDSSASTRPPSDRLRIVYGLTEAEARVASLIVAGLDLAGIAASVGVSMNTAKFHLKTVFGKIGVARQADLVRRILADVGGLADPASLQERPDWAPSAVGTARRSDFTA